MKSSSLQVGDFRFQWGSKTYVMGILNVTPDSFSGDGILAKSNFAQAVVEQAREFLASGAHILNDVWGLRADPDLASVAAALRVPVILMHNRSNPASVEVRNRLGNAYLGAEYVDVIADVKRELMDKIGRAHV